MGVERGDREAGEPRPAHDEPRVRAVRVEQRVRRLRRGRALERRVGAVDRLRPRLDGPPRGGLEHGGREAPVDDGEVERLRARVARVVDVDDLGDRGVGHGVGDRELGDGVVVHARVIRPRRGDDRRVEVVGALGVLLDRVQDPAVVVAAQGPVLRERRELVVFLVALDDVAVAVDHDVAQDRDEADDDAVLGVVLAVGEAEVLDVRAAADLAHVVPALALEVVEPPHPLGEQVGPEVARERRRGRGPSTPRRSRGAGLRRRP